jgi:hypothetical protein
MVFKMFIELNFTEGEGRRNRSTQKKTLKELMAGAKSFLK